MDHTSYYYVLLLCIVYNYYVYYVYKKQTGLKMVYVEYWTCYICNIIKVHKHNINLCYYK